MIGERWLVGGKTLLEVTSPRNPCGTFERRMGVTGWVKRFEEHGAPGTYFRVDPLRRRAATATRSRSSTAPTTA